MIRDLGDLVARIRSHEAPIRALGIAHLDIFGSWARRSATEQSDVDVVASFESDLRASYFDLARLQELLQNELRTSVDVLSDGGVRASGKNLGKTIRVF